ncbi:MAG: 5-formyltetrahydrofolate cyclo-ligase [Tissierellia bacterium]|nr:5-formyltetrahydrofolate cyclo-ligase [Tissierellia bacterium]
MDKKSLRQELRKLRGSLGEENRIKYSEEIWKTLKELDQFKDAKKIGIYLDFGSEVKTTSYALELIGDKEVYVPRLRGREMDFVELTGLDGMKAGAFGILEPVKGKVIPPEELDLILMPGLGFTLDGARLGYGGGYYDSYLPSTRAYLLALAYEVQIKDKLPIEKWDWPIHGLVTEKSFYSF